MAKSKKVIKMKSLIPIDNDIAPLFKKEKNKTRLVNDLLSSHYKKAPIGMHVEEIEGMRLAEIKGMTLENDTLSENEEIATRIKTDSNIEPTPENAELENPMVLVDGRIEDTPKEFIGGDPDGNVWN